MKVNNPYLEVMAVSKKGWPGENLPEIALVGRSNVGKSSFINSLCRRKKLAHTSASPGKTATINFYNMDEKFRIVDLPGYGYAKVSKSERAKWAKFVNDYLADRKNLKDVILVCDMRREPNSLDIEMYEWILDAGFSGRVIATKADKIARTKWPAQIKAIMAGLGVKDKDKVQPYSTEKDYGYSEIEKYFANYIKV